MTTSGAHSYHPPERKPIVVVTVKKRCSECGASYIGHGGYHAERCPGPPQRVAPPKPEPVSCDCPPGFMHLPTCYLVTGDAAA